MTCGNIRKKFMKAFKTEISLIQEQQNKVYQTMGACRFVYNLYIAYNKQVYKETKKFVSGYTFSKWLNTEYLLNNPDKSWLKDSSSKAIKKSIMNAESAFKRFFNKKSKFPRYKFKHHKQTSMYFINSGLIIKRHKIKIPTIGWVKLKEFGYLPTTYIPYSGTVTTKAGRFFVSIIYKNMPDQKQATTFNNSIGIDLGLKNFAVMSNNTIFGNINKTKRVLKLTKTLKRRQRRFSNRLHMNKQKGDATASAKNIDKSALKVQKIHFKLANIRANYINSIVNYVAKTKPAYVAIEDLNIKGMLKNRHLSKAIANQSFYAFRCKLINKCKAIGVQVRIVNRWFASSKTCSVCGHKHTNLKLYDRIFVCPQCGYTPDRDFNAAVNLNSSSDYVLV